jgi:hypothetical protein
MEMGQLLVGAYGAGNRMLAALNITPNSSLPGTSALEGFVGGLVTFIEIICFAALISAAGSWAWGGHSGNYKMASQGRTGLLWALVALIIVGSANALANWALGISIGL